MPGNGKGGDGLSGLCQPTRGMENPNGGVVHHVIVGCIMDRNK
jgi:hypothetical protein